LQGLALIGIGTLDGFTWWFVGGVVLGIGTAMVYPTLIAAVSDVAHPSWRARAIGVYRLWRDTGYAVGAIGAGVLADFFGLAAAILTVGAVTLMSGAFVALRMPETKPHV